MAELEIGSKFQALGCRDVAKGCEDHVRDRSTGEYNTADELADEVDAALLVCDGHDDADGDEEDCADAKC